MNSIRENDIGTIVELVVEEDGVVVDLSGATTKTIIFLDPKGNVLSKTASFSTDGTDGKIRYVSVDGDLDIPGTWRVQAYLVLSAWRGHTTIARFVVDEVFTS